MLWDEINKCRCIDDRVELDDLTNGISQLYDKNKYKDEAKSKCQFQLLLTVLLSLTPIPPHLTLNLLMKNFV